MVVVAGGGTVPLSRFSSSSCCSTSTYFTGTSTTVETSLPVSDSRVGPGVVSKCRVLSCCADWIGSQGPPDVTDPLTTPWLRL